MEIGRTLHRLEEILEGRRRLLKVNFDQLPRIRTIVLLHMCEPTHVFIAIIVPHPAHGAVVERPPELCRCYQNIMGYLMDDDWFLLEIAVFLQCVDSVVRNPTTARLLTNDDKLLVEVEARVVFDGDVVSLERAVALEGEVCFAGEDGHGDWGGLEGGAGELEEVKQTVEDLLGPQAQLALVLLLDVLEDGLDGVAIRIA